MLHFALAAFLAPAVAVAPQPCAFDLVGTWNLVSVSSRSADGRTNEAPLGPNPSGVLIYTTDGHMSAIITYGGRKLLSSDDRLGGSLEERAHAFDTSLGYAGRYYIGSLLVAICARKRWLVAGALILLIAHYFGYMVLNFVVRETGWIPG